jgi:hypothetical protein
MAEFSHIVRGALVIGSGLFIQKVAPHAGSGPTRERNPMLPVPQIPGGLAVSIVGIVNGAINGIFPQVLALLRSLGIPV